MNMKKLKNFSGLLLALLVFASCKNPIVTEFLQDIATVDNISITTIDNQGDAPELNYGFTPAFAARSFNYKVLIPKKTATLSVAGVPHDGETVRYHISYKAQDTVKDPAGIEYPLVYLPHEEDSPDGVFNLPPIVKFFTVTLKVSKEYRLDTTYTILVIRLQPAWLAGIDVTTWSQVDTGNPSSPVTPGTFKYPFSPGFNSNILEYEVGVNSNAVAFNVAVNKRATDFEHITISYLDDPGEVISETATGTTVKYDFPMSVKKKSIRIQVANPDEDPDPLIYTLTIIRPEQVAAAAGKEANFSIAGAEGYYFQSNDLVNFSVTPPFGYTIGSVSATATPSGQKLAFLQGEEGTGTNSYTFIMPRERVILDAVWVPVPKAAAPLNVRYVYEKGSGDGSTWANATNDLQSLIDKYNDTPGNPNNYEIWIAAGTIRPVWAWVNQPRSSWPAWAAAIADDQLTNDNWCFVLKN
ncbi:MAG: hypothetical protein FWC45_01955, partial [Treponema sp.]|nr:hypothetical protein [Treponema sp.]